MEIVRYPHPALRRASKPVRRVDDGIRQVAREMLALMDSAGGLGLAANQVALPIQLFVMNIRTEPEEEQGEERVFINPRILERKGVVEHEEGCLSLPGLYAKVKRAERIKVTAQDLDGTAFELEADGLTSRVIEHEVDHLRGVLFIDKLAPLVKLSVVDKIKEFERDYRRSQQAGEIPPNKEIERELVHLEAAYS